MDMDKNSGIMVQKSTLESSMRAKNMVEESSCGKMAHFMRVILLMDYFMDLEFITLKNQKRLILGSLILVKLRGREKWSGQMEDHMSANLLKAKKKVKVLLNGLMEIHTLVSLRMGRCVAMLFT